MAFNSTLAPRGHALSKGPNLKSTFGQVLRDPYHTELNPNGGVNFSASENNVMTPDVAAFARKALESTTALDFTYGEGPWGSLGFREGMAKFMNKYFGPPFQEVKEAEILPVSGVTSLCQMLAFTLFEAGDGILMNRPIYQAFPADFSIRADVQCVFASFKDVDQFSKEGCVAGYEKALQQAEANGTKIRALMLCNPHNPLGKCYTKEAIIELMKFCSKHKLHMLSDEIYALSVYEVPDPHTVPFTSVLSFDISPYIDSNYLHVLYGFSKDFASGGLRRAVIQSRNAELMAALDATVQFHWTGSLDNLVAVRMLEDDKWQDEFFALSRSRLSHCNKLCRSYLDSKGIKYLPGSNAGFFMWVDLRSHLQQKEGEDAWDAEQRLYDRFFAHKIYVNNGKLLNADEPGWFRLIFVQDDETLKEGFKRMFEVLGI
ncbi:PLP-dependent transferase [Polychaeton citri CBS 116435]|uniref:PLP-dependent transferase n=1 Tax=Polychaeton citri CBS 116435 TaxID=1314669 RepID=A0A9P4QH46_9PEZI|nr:PLP-dependent transferase [Polychaeton citri CBS 116435]